MVFRTIDSKNPLKIWCLHSFIIITISSAATFLFATTSPFNYNIIFCPEKPRFNGDFIEVSFQSDGLEFLLLLTKAVREREK